jgi:hypothetical protein
LSVSSIPMRSRPTREAENGWTLGQQRLAFVWVGTQHQ